MSITVEDLSVSLGGHPVLFDAGMELRSGELLGLIGPNGSGKSTLIRAVLGLQKRDSGKICIDDRDRDAYGRRELARQLAYLPQDHTVHWPMSVEATVALGREPHLGPFGRRSAADREIVERVMRETDVGAFKGRSVRTLSAGERARVLLARAIAVQAPYLLADEPTAALDPRHQLTVMKLLQGHTRQGVGTLVVVHDLALAAQFCDRVCLLHEGRIMAAGRPEDVLNDDNIAAAYGVETVRIRVGDASLIVPVSVKVT